MTALELYCGAALKCTMRLSNVFGGIVAFLGDIRQSGRGRA